MRAQLQCKKLAQRETCVGFWVSYVCQRRLRRIDSVQSEKRTLERSQTLTYTHLRGASPPPEVFFAYGSRRLTGNHKTKAVGCKRISASAESSSTRVRISNQRRS